MPFTTKRKPSRHMSRRMGRPRLRGPPMRKKDIRNAMFCALSFYFSSDQTRHKMCKLQDRLPDGSQSVAGFSANDQTDSTLESSSQKSDQRADVERCGLVAGMMVPNQGSTLSEAPSKRSPNGIKYRGVGLAFHGVRMIK